MTDKEISNKLDKIIALLQQSVAVQLFIAGANKGDIHKNLKGDRNRVFAMLSGLGKIKNEK